MSTSDGGPAFPGFAFIGGYGACKPVPMPNGGFEWANYEGGMSLRDYFAAAALQSIILRPMNDNGSPRYDTGGWEPDNIRLASHVRTAYTYADAMLAAREKP